MKQILIVEDEAKIAQIHEDYLQSNDYATSKLTDGAVVVEWVKTNLPDLVLLDLMLPNKDGISICREIRTFSQIPIIMVTARVEEIDRVLGLEIGANDYICKPFSPREVVARINALFRLIDSLGKTSTPWYEDQPFQFNSERMEVRYAGAIIDLTAVEYKLLYALQQPPYRVFSRQQLTERIYDDHRVITDRTIDTHIKNLRRKVETAGCDEEVITSVYGVGYKWSILISKRSSRK